MGLEHLQKHLLNPSVDYRRDAQEPGAAAVKFGYFHSPHRAGHIRPRQEFDANGFPVLTYVVA